MNKDRDFSGRAKACVKDLLKAFLVGAAAGAVLAILLFLVGLAAGGGVFAAALETAKDGMFLVTAIALFILAGMILVKGKKPEKSQEESGWRNHFTVIGFKLAIGMVAVAFVLWAVILDYVQIFLR